MNDSLVYTNREVLPTSRYKICRAIRDKDGVVFLEFPSVFGFRRFKPALHVVRSFEVNRIDKLAYTYYQDASFWWLIAAVNSFIDPFILKEGDLILIPPMEVVFQMRGYDE